MSRLPDACLLAIRVRLPWVLQQMGPEMDLSKEQRVHRMEIIRAHQNHARLQAESFKKKGGGGINLAGHPWVLYNGLYTPSGFEVEGFPVYNNSHGKWLFHPLPTAWDSEVRCLPVVIIDSAVLLKCWSAANHCLRPSTNTNTLLPCHRHRAGTAKEGRRLGRGAEMPAVRTG